MLLKHFRIEQLCPSFDSMISFVYVHYAIMLSQILTLMKIMCSMCTAKRMIPRGSHSTQFESFLIVSTKTGEKSLEINVKRQSMLAWNDV